MWMRSVAVTAVALLAAAYPNPGRVTGDTGVHDPSVVRSPGGTYIVASHRRQHRPQDVHRQDRLAQRRLGVSRRRALDHLVHQWQQPALGTGHLVPQRPLLHVLRGVQLRLPALGDLPGHQPDRHLRYVDQPGPGHRDLEQQRLQRDRPEPHRRPGRPVVADVRLVLDRHQDGHSSTRAPASAPTPRCAASRGGPARRPRSRRRTSSSTAATTTCGSRSTVLPGRQQHVPDHGRAVRRTSPARTSIATAPR